MSAQAQVIYLSVADAFDQHPRKADNSFTTALAIKGTGHNQYCTSPFPEPADFLLHPAQAQRLRLFSEPDMCIGSDQDQEIVHAQADAIEAHSAVSGPQGSGLPL